MLFSQSQLIGTFKGFNDKGLEFAAEIVAPYDASMLDQPQLGQFILIELSNPEEAALGRITRFVPSGLLATAEGEDYVNTMQRRQQIVPEDLKKARLKYRVHVKLLGAVRVVGNDIIYVPSQRRLPHLGAKVALPSAAVLQKLCRLSGGTTDMGDYVLGEFVFSGAGAKHEDPTFRSADPKLTVTFAVNNLVSRRSVVFARAGYGKSNLMKYLLSELYRETPRTPSGTAVGTLLFDADGEYFWPDRVSGRPGLCDVPQLQDKLVLFTNRRAPSPYYGSWKLGEVRLDIRDLTPRDVISIALSPERQDQQNVLKLKAMSHQNWRELVDLIDAEGLQVSDGEMARLLGYSPEQARNSLAEIAAARSNMSGVVRALHDPNSTLLSGTLRALSEGCVVVVDISLLSSTGGEVLAGLLLRKVFSHNQEHFTGGEDILPVIAVIEEAQSVLGKRLEETSPFVEWVKEGRKYDLGAVLITQQPGSLASEILSQADNWFCFHLLSEGDASVLGKYNSHYSDDVLAHLIAEPIRGNCFMWSAPHQPFVLPVRVRSFEQLYRDYVRSEANAGRSESAPALRFADLMSESLARLQQSVLEKLKQSNVKYVLLRSDQGKLIGILSGQLFYLIKESRQIEDTRGEDDLKVPVMEAIFGSGCVRQVQHGGKEYFCAPETDWERVLGFKPRVKPA